MSSGSGRVQQVTKHVTEDGREWDTEAEADFHHEVLDLGKKLEAPHNDLCMRGRGYEVAAWILTNYTLTRSRLSIIA